VQLAVKDGRTDVSCRMSGKAKNRYQISDVRKKLRAKNKQKIKIAGSLQRAVKD